MDWLEALADGGDVFDVAVEEVEVCDATPERLEGRGELLAREGRSGGSERGATNLGDLGDQNIALASKLGTVVAHELVEEVARMTEVTKKLAL